MRKSNLFLIAALAVLLVSLGMYNVALKKAYLTGSYKDPFQNFKPLDLANFQAIEVNAANKISVKVLPGKFRVWVHERSTDQVKVKLVGKRLQIDVKYPEKEGLMENVIITCPTVSEIKVNSFYWVKGRKEIQKHAPWGPPVTVEGFTLDSLVLLQDNGSRIRLVKNRIGTLRALTGMSAGSSPRLEIESDNIIAEAHLAARHKASLALNSPQITRLYPDFGDSIQVSFSGAALSLLKK